MKKPRKIKYTMDALTPTQKRLLMFWKRTYIRVAREEPDYSPVSYFEQLFRIAIQTYFVCKAKVEWVMCGSPVNPSREQASSSWSSGDISRLPATSTKVFAYVRAETHEALEFQLKMVNEKAKELGYTCERIFYDVRPGSGAVDPFCRPGFSKVITTLENSPWGAKIITLDPIRISRSMSRWAHINNRLNELGAEILYVDQVGA